MKKQNTFKSATAKAATYERRRHDLIHRQRDREIKRESSQPDEYGKFQQEERN